MIIGMERELDEAGLEAAIAAFRAGPRRWAMANAIDAYIDVVESETAPDPRSSYLTESAMDLVEKVRSRTYDRINAAAGDSRDKSILDLSQAIVYLAAEITYLKTGDSACER
jgi:hypothetical protein